jgi:flagellar basal-body rod protein FlgF
MNYGLYLSASGAMTAMHKQDVYANNLANVNTIGFKPDSVFTRHRLPERIEQPHLHADPHKLLEQLGGGQFIDPTFTNLTQGALTATDRPLDVAIDGEGFFVISTGAAGTMNSEHSADARRAVHAERSQRAGHGFHRPSRA